MRTCLKTIRSYKMYEARCKMGGKEEERRGEGRGGVNCSGARSWLKKPYPRVRQGILHAASSRGALTAAILHHLFVLSSAFMFRLGLNAVVTISSHFAAYEYEGKTTPPCQILSAGFKAFLLFIIHLGLAKAKVWAASAQHWMVKISSLVFKG